MARAWNSTRVAWNGTRMAQTIVPSAAIAAATSARRQGTGSKNDQKDQQAAGLDVGGYGDMEAAFKAASLAEQAIRARQEQQTASALNKADDPKTKRMAELAKIDRRLEELVVGREYESICLEGDWWKVHIKAKNANGSYVAKIMDSTIETEWGEVWPGNCREVQSSSQLQAVSGIGEAVQSSQADLTGSLHSMTDEKKPARQLGKAKFGEIGFETTFPCQLGNIASGYI